MKGIFQKTIVDIIEKADDRYLVATTYAQFHIDEQAVVAIPDEIYLPNQDRLQEIDKYIKEVQDRTERLKISYCTKKQELSMAESHARLMKRQLIECMLEKAIQESNHG